MFLGVFASVLDACFKCFICLLLYVVIIASGFFKNRSGVVHGIRVVSNRRRGQRSGQRGRRPGRRGPTTDALPRPMRYTLGPCSAGWKNGRCWCWYWFIMREKYYYFAETVRLLSWGERGLVCSFTRGSVRTASGPSKVRKTNKQ